MIKFHAVLNVKKLPTKCEANTNSLITMTSDNYLTKMRKKMGNKNILLFSHQHAALKRHNIYE